MVAGGSVPLFVLKLHQFDREVCFVTLKRYRQKVLECNASFFFILAFSQCKNRELPRPRGMFAVRTARYATMFGFQTFNDCYISNFLLHHQ